MNYIITIFFFFLSIQLIIIESKTFAYSDNVDISNLEGLYESIRAKRSTLMGVRKNKWNSPIKYTPTNHRFVNQTRIDNALKVITQHTCLEFQKVDKIENEPGLTLIGQGRCNSRVGRVYNDKPQPVVLSFGCDYLSGVHHEVGHALGLIHEHMRSDRDQYVIINKKNIAGFGGNFNKYKPNQIDSFNISYDYGSALHYPKGAIAQQGKISIQPKDPNYLDTIGQALGLKFNDYKQVNIMHCDHVCKTKLTNCTRGGYTDPKNCSICRCPPHYTGRYCEEYRTSNPKCGNQTVFNATDNEQIIHVNNTLSCFFYINTEESYKIFIRIMYTDLHTFQYCPNKQALEIRYRGDPSVMGAMFCGKKQNVTMTSESNHVSIHYVGMKPHHFAIFAYKRVKVENKKNEYD